MPPVLHSELFALSSFVLLVSNSHFRLLFGSSAEAVGSAVCSAWKGVLGLSSVSPDRRSALDERWASVLISPELLEKKNANHIID